MGSSDLPIKRFLLGPLYRARHASSSTTSSDKAGLSQTLLAEQQAICRARRERDPDERDHSRGARAVARVPRGCNRYQSAALKNRLEPAEVRSAAARERRRPAQLGAGAARADSDLNRVTLNSRLTNMWCKGSCKGSRVQVSVLPVRIAVGKPKSLKARSG